MYYLFVLFVCFVDLKKKYKRKSQAQRLGLFGVCSVYFFGSSFGLFPLFFLAALLASKSLTYFSFSFVILVYSFLYAVNFATVGVVWFSGCSCVCISTHFLRSAGINKRRNNSAGFLCSCSAILSTIWAVSSSKLIQNWLVNFLAVFIGSMSFLSLANCVYFLLLCGWVFKYDGNPSFI